MAGVYIHIPFCRQACHYCDFHFSTQLQSVEDMADAIVQEAALRAQQSPAWDGASVQTLYLGGGTPSVLPPTTLARLVNGVTQALGIERSGLTEFTLEANPEDLDEARIRAWLDLGVQRLSVGVQTFHTPSLRWMNRLHTGEQAREGLARAHGLGVRALSMDLIYGVPTDRDWRADIATALELPLTHLSAYALTVEPRTVLAHRVSHGDVQESAEGVVAAEYHLLCDALRARGWHHYETSNWAAPDGANGHHVARHNSAYWSGVPYLGLGPGAHGFDGKSRYANVANNPAYLRALGRGQLAATSETLTDADRYNESLMTGLRTAAGVRPDALERAWGLRPDRVEPRTWEQLLASGSLEALESGAYRIPERLWITGNAVTSSLFYVP